MDVICFNCAEPWDIHTVIHDEPESFKRRGCLIRAYPCCQGEPRQLPYEMREDLNALAEVALMNGDDLDGFACFLEDFYFGGSF